MRDNDHNAISVNPLRLAYGVSARSFENTTGLAGSGTPNRLRDVPHRFCQGRRGLKKQNTFSLSSSRLNFSRMQ